MLLSLSFLSSEYVNLLRSRPFYQRGAAEVNIIMINRSISGRANVCAIRVFVWIPTHNTSSTDACTADANLKLN